MLEFDSNILEKQTDVRKPMGATGNNVQGFHLK